MSTQLAPTISVQVFPQGIFFVSNVLVLLHRLCCNALHRGVLEFRPMATMASAVSSVKKQQEPGMTIAARGG